MPDLFVIVNEAGNIESVNAAALEAFGYSGTELNGQSSRLILETPNRLSPDTPSVEWPDAEAHPVLRGIHRSGRRFPLRLTEHEVHGAQNYRVLHLRPPEEPYTEERVFLRHKELYEVATSLGRVGVWEVDYRTNRLEFSPVVARLLGLTDEQIPTTVEGWSKQFHPDDWRRLEEEAARLIRRESSELNLECRMFRANGGISWNFIRGKVIFDGDIPIKAVGTNIDITEQKHAEHCATVEHAITRVLAASPNLPDAGAQILAAVCESLDWQIGALWRVDASSNLLQCVRTWRDGAASLDEFEQTTHTSTFAPGIGLPGRVWSSCEPAWVPDVTRDGNFPRSATASKAGLHAALAFPILFENNVLGVLEFFSREIRQPDVKLLRMMTAVGSQIGQFIKRKKAEEERDLLFTLSLDMLCIADLSGIFRRVNPAFTKILGFTSEELTAKPFLDFIHPEDKQATTAVMEGLAHGTDVSDFENRYRCKDGSYRWLSWKCAAPTPGSETLYAIARDVTDAKRVQAALEQAVREAERANRAKSDFLSRMSHELRTPLNAILGFGQLLLREPLSERQAGHADLIVKAGRHLLNLINEVLDITRIEVGRLDLSPEPIALTDAFEEAIGLTRPMALARGIEIKVDAPTPLGRTVIADRQRLKQVLLNLLSNAIKYNVDKGRVTLRVEPMLNGRVRIHVADTGRGIASDKLHRLFAPFDRLGAEVTGIEGSGLGLVLSKRLVEVMGGTLSFSAVPGAGSCFTIELAQGKVERVTAAGSITNSTLAPVMTPPRTVLCIEDNDVNIRLIQAVLGSRPAVRLVSATQGSTALELAQSEKPDVILLDVHLPDTNGATLLRTFRADPALRNVPVIVISADATVDQIDRLLATGAGEYLTKPIDIDQLLRVLDRYLQ